MKSVLDQNLEDNSYEELGKTKSVNISKKTKQSKILGKTVNVPEVNCGIL